MALHRTRSLVLGVVAAAVVAACGAAFIAPDVTPELVQIGQAQWADTTQASLQKGHDQFVASCGKPGGCHNLPTPGSRTVEQWRKIIIRMGKNAKLNDEQREGVLRFILAVRDLPPATAPAAQ